MITEAQFRQHHQPVTGLPHSRHPAHVAERDTFIKHSTRRILPSTWHIFVAGLFAYLPKAHATMTSYLVARRTGEPSLDMQLSSAAIGGMQACLSHIQRCADYTFERGNTTNYHVLTGTGPCSIGLSALNTSAAQCIRLQARTEYAGRPDLSDFMFWSGAFMCVTFVGAAIYNDCRIDLWRGWNTVRPRRYENDWARNIP